MISEAAGQRWGIKLLVKVHFGLPSCFEMVLTVRVVVIVIHAHDLDRLT